jgi:hypothetical protein
MTPFIADLKRLALAASDPHTHMDEDGLYDCDTCNASQDMRRELSPERVLALLDVVEAAKAQDAQFSRVLHELAGAASVCWKDGAVPTGEFDSTQACEHVANAVEELRGYMSDARAKLGELK